MTEDIKNLYKKFCFIKDMGFIKSKRKGSTGVGYTFEELINKPEESFPIPDFNSIEIKTCRYQSRQAIHLFTATPDGDFLFPIKRIIDILGYPDKDIKTSKVFNFSFNGKSYSNIGYHKRGKIVVNWKDEKIDFIALDLVNNNLNVDVSWSFDLLQEKLNTFRGGQGEELIIRGWKFLDDDNHSSWEEAKNCFLEYEKEFGNDNLDVIFGKLKSLEQIELGN